MPSVKVPEEVLEIFPYRAVRAIQDELITTTFHALKERKNVVIEGANGLGKTIAALTAVLPIAREKDLQIVHICRTNKQADRVISELKEISKKTPISGVSIRGRKEMCPHELVQKHADDAATASVLCGQLKKLRKCDYYNRMNDRLPHLKNALKVLSKTPSTSTEILEFCEESRICPYELILKLIDSVEVVAASYQYIFNPNIRETFLNKISRSMDEIVLIVDECHNIIDTAIDISSEQLSLYSIRQALKEAKAFNKVEFIRLLRELIAILESFQERAESEKQIDAQKILLQLSREVGATLDLDYADKLIAAGFKIQKEYLARNKPPRSFLHRLGRFLRKFILTKSRPEFLHLVSNYRTRTEGWGTRFEVISLDARFTTKRVLEYVYNSIHISGTIEPIEAYTKIVGLDKLPLVTKVLPSPYTKANVQCYIINKLSTKLADRTPETYQKMTDVIAEAVNNTPANSGIFTASYVVLESLLDAGLERKIQLPLFYETKKMTATGNDRLVNEFKSFSSKGGAALMGVLGGRSSEGADFPGELMNTCIIVGIPYARPTTRIEAQIAYLDEQFEKKGREFGYIIPAMRRASQAAGRPIRSINDKGLIIFLDYRFAHTYTSRFLPVWIKENMRLLNYEPGIIASIAQEFFK
ncbi:MAG: ATP-dependent DNA helicase [Candidatus Heimdallarchaeota archaeon]|nr:ATP-dependent DNA helicase [Candidatus Heimdallarchaeota archaeon]